MAIRAPTGDMDLWIRVSDENARRVWDALERFRAPRSKLTVEDLKTPNLVFQIGLTPRRIDILTSIDGVEFEDAWGERQTIELEGQTIGVIGRSHLVQNKKAAGRPQDLADVAWLEGNDES